jgi:uncharacterized protein DUF3606
MTDDKTKKAGDSRRIDVHETYELGYWSRKFGVSREQLAEAVQKVGPMADDVERELGR